MTLWTGSKNYAEHSMTRSAQTKKKNATFKLNLISKPIILIIMRRIGDFKFPCGTKHFLTETFHSLFSFLFVVVINLYGIM